MNIRRVYDILLRLYPTDYRAMFAAEMSVVFERATEERRERGWPVFARFVLAELTGLVMGAGAAWIAKFTGRGAAIQGTLPEEVMEAQKRVDLDISRTVYAISHHDFPNARFYSEQERKDRGNLLLLREKYKIDE